MTYRERIALPPSAVVTVRLVDVSLADAPSVLITEQVIRTEGRQVPFEFALAYDASRILPSHTYAVQARIEDGDRLLFISDTMNPVITRDAPTRVDIVSCDGSDLCRWSSRSTGRPGSHEFTATLRTSCRKAASSKA